MGHIGVAAGWTPVKATDADLIRACREGDRAAWEALLARYQRLIYSVPLRCGLSEDDAADVFQTVCVRLLENLGRLRDEQRLGSWLVTTASREAWRVQRCARRDTPLSAEGAEDGETGAEALPDPGLLPEDAAARLEDQHLVRQAVEEMGERCRIMLRLLYYTEPAPPYAEIAAQLGMPEGSVGPTRARCLQQLRRILEKHGF